uniref:Uncharacterized protein n=1 Tax=Meloidogyne hapla TaxID=6305 RepID=A0A1I8C173_MELHA
MENIVTWIGIVIFMVIYNESTTAPTPSETTAVPNPKKKIYCGMFACPNCEGWCSNNTMEYSCKYSCKYEGFELMYGNCPDPKKNLASDIYSSLYPM